MNNRKNIFVKSIAVLLAFAMIITPIGKIAVAADLKEPVFAYGESLTEKEKQKTKETLGVSDNAKSIKVKIDELNYLLKDDYDYYQAYSSVYMIPGGEGISVQILTPNTITTITERQYANAAITAGASNMKILVSSVKEVDGSGALAGVYKAFSEQKAELPEENIKVAQEELVVTSNITENNKDKSGYSDDALNAAVAEIKVKVQDAKDDAGGDESKVNVGEIVNDTLDNYRLDNVITESDKSQLVQLMEDFKKLKLTPEQKDALMHLGKTIIEKGGEIIDGARTFWDNLDEGTKSGIFGFFEGLWNGMVNFFKGLLNNL